MIISKKHKFIFIKPQKTAGTSVELLLSQICGYEDIITPFGNDPDPLVRKKNNAKEPQNYIRKLGWKYWSPWSIYNYLKDRSFANRWSYREHSPAREIKKYIGEDIWNAYFKISMVRNPWDQAASWFDWQSKHGNNPILDFDEFLNNRYYSQWYFYTTNTDDFEIDYVIKFENITKDVELLFQKLKHDNVQLPHTKKDTRIERDYKKYYTSKEQIELVRFKNLQIIDMFDYKF